MFGLIVLGAIATVYLTTAPRLQDRLTEQKLDGLEADAARRSAPDWSTARSRRDRRARPLARRVARAAARSSAEVLVLKPLEGEPAGLTLAEDSTATAAWTVRRRRGLALTAFETGKPQTTTLNAGVGRQALAAEPLMRAARRSSASRCSRTRSPTSRPTWR